MGICTFDAVYPETSGCMAISREISSSQSHSSLTEQFLSNLSHEVIERKRDISDNIELNVVLYLFPFLFRFLTGWATMTQIQQDMDAFEDWIGG